MKYTKTQIQDFDNEDQFMDAYVELLKQTILLITQVTKLRYFHKDGSPKQLNRDEAVIGGNMIRLIKLNTSLLQNICDKKLEICYIINRCLIETAVNVKFILTKGEVSVIKNYIKYSLITEKEAMDVISSNIDNRAGDILPIEERMKKSIQSSFEKSDFDFDEVKKSSKWKSFKDRVKVIESNTFYTFNYGISSHAVHGNWQDILSNNLIRNNEFFELNLHWKRPKPQIMDAAIHLNIEIIEIFATKELEEYKDSIINQCKALTYYYAILLESSENYINKTLSK